MTYVGDGETEAVLARAGEAPSTTVGSMTAAVLATGATTEGSYSLYRLSLAARAPGARPHFHRTFAESFHVLLGEVELFDGLRWVPAGRDDHLYIPAGSIHGFRNATAAPAEMLMMSAPAVRREEYFEELHQIVERGLELAPEERAAMLARHDQYMVS